MRIFSEELMELGAEYDEGIVLRGRGFEMRIRPSAELSALSLAVRCRDAEFAGELLASAGKVIEALEAGG